MKRITTIVCGALMSSLSLNAQIVTTGTATTTPLYTGGKLGLGYTTVPSTFTGQLQLNVNSDNRQIVLNGGASNAFQFAGVGFNNSQFKLNVPSSTDDFVFYAGANSTTSSELMRVKGNGTVLMGTASTAGSMQVLGNSNTSMYLRNYGVTGQTNLTIGIPNNAWGFSSFAAAGDLVYRSSSTAFNSASMIFHNYGGTSMKFAVRDKLVMKMNENGQVTIGDQTITSGPNMDFKLAVDGKLVTKSFRITSLNWADYVFADDYKLKPLSEVEDYIKANNHLPSIPSATEIEGNGVNVGDMLQLHMEKIEELTLYLIEMKKQNDELSKEVKVLQTQITTLK